jgi:hypothetical protein
MEEIESGAGRPESSWKPGPHIDYFLQPDYYVTTRYLLT